jgi:DNA-binding HxlR family transcriptional regulator
VTRRSYDQPDCGLAVALDLLGERWTLLIIRELLLGPQRYTDLSEGLSGLSTNLLAGRLRHLEQAGVVKRSELPPPAACTVYELTELGEDLEPMVVALARWGARFANCSTVTDPRAAAFAMVARQQQGEPSGSEEPVDTGECRIDIDGFSIAVHLHGGRLRLRAHAPVAPIAQLSTTGQVYLSLLDGELSLDEAVTEGRARIDGDTTQLTAVFARLEHR